MITTILFDFDGTLCDSLDCYYEVTKELLKKYNIHITFKEFKKNTGIPAPVIFENLFQGTNFDTNLIYEEWKHMLDLHLSQQTKPMLGAVQTLHKLRSQGFDLGIGTGSPTHHLNVLAEKIHVKPLVSHIVTRDMVRNGKPHPETWLTLAKRFNTKPQHCVVVEDGVAGMQGAKKAGMKCIAINNDQPNLPADKKIEHLADITKSLLQSL